jgi:hypothetical protein
MLSYVPYGKKCYYYHYFYSVSIVACTYHTKGEAEIPPVSQFLFMLRLNTLSYTVTLRQAARPLGFVRCNTPTHLRSICNTFATNSNIVCGTSTGSNTVCGSEIIAGSGRRSCHVKVGRCIRDMAFHLLVLCLGELWHKYGQEHSEADYTNQ